jgi:hypothetical protein
MSKKVEAKILEYLPQLAKRTTWEEAWDTLVETTKIEGSCKVVDTRKEKRAIFKIWNHGEVVTELELPFNKFVIKPSNDLDWDLAFKAAFDYIIKYKMIRKPRQTKTTSNKQAAIPPDELAQLKKERDNLTMRIYTWKQAGKDTTELDKLKLALVERIKKINAKNKGNQ